LIDGTLVKEKKQYLFETSFGTLEISAPINKKTEDCLIAIFPEHINVSEEKTNDTNEFSAVIRKSSFGGPYIDLVVLVDSTDLEVQIKSSSIEKIPKNDQEIFITIPKEFILILEK
jgi:hypothetical protein